MIGIAGYGVCQALFGLSSSLWMMYGARMIGGILSSATLPVAGAYIADTSTLEERSMAMGRMNAAMSPGVVFGPVLGGMLTRTDLHFKFLLALCRRIHVWRLGTVPSLTREEPSLWVSVAL